MPSGNEKRDKIVDFIIKIENERRRLSETLAFLIAERDGIKYRLYNIRVAVNKIPNKPLRDILIWYYFDGQSVSDIAEKMYMTPDGVYKKINRFLKRGSRYDARKQNRVVNKPQSRSV